MAQAVQILTQAQPQRPEANNRFGRMQLILIAAHQLFKISKLRFHCLAQCHGLYDLLQTIRETGRDVEASHFAGSIDGSFDDQHLTSTQLLDFGPHQKGIDGLSTFLVRLQNRSESFFGKLGGIIGQRHQNQQPFCILGPQLVVFL